MVALDNPIGVINSLQAQIEDLEGRLGCANAAAGDRNAKNLADGIRRLRLHGVITLYVGPMDQAALQAEVESTSPELSAILDQVWMLSAAPVAREVRNSLAIAAGNGMSRWATRDQKDATR
ncbi:hypothetical protein [Paracidovorax oryzae]|uniref:hypothetical protein n=1 Tax=Paracidovorax oryzae TaxID=862720 RepID=UPI00047BEE83|nr:hypothetical protein [Paracidovorax oryzae]